MASVSLTNYDSQVAELNRRQKLAELLQQQSSDPIQVFSSQHGIQAPIPWTAVLAKALQGGLSGYESKKAFEGQKALESSRRDEAKQFIQGLGGIGAQPMPVQTLPQTPDLQLAPNRPQPPGAVSPPPMQAPPPQPGYAEQPGTATTPMQDAQERQSRALQASVSGNPYLEKLAPTVYSEGEKDKERARVSSAIDDLPFDAAHKALIKQVAEFGGPQAAASAVNSLIKPVNETNEVKNYMFAKQNGYTKSFVDYQQDTNPNKFLTKGAAGSQIFSAADLLHGSQGGGPTEQGPQLAELVTQNFPNAKITSTLRTPAQNAAVGGVPNSEHMVPDGAIDFVLGSPAEMQEAAAKINSAGAGFKAIYEGAGSAHSTGPHVHIERIGAEGPSGPAKPLAVVPPNPQRAAGTAAWQLSSEEQAALNKAVGEGRVDAKGLNSRTGKITAGILMANPGVNLMQNHAFAQGMANAPMQQKIVMLHILPQILTNVRDAGTKVDFSNLKVLGDFQAFAKRHTNDPDFINYMTQRNDAILTLANAMRGVGMSDKAMEVEHSSAPVTMSPRAFDAWLDGQLTAIKPRIEGMAPFDASHPGQPGAAPAVRSKADILKQYGIH